MDLFVNQLLEYVTASVDRRIDRILWINKDGQELLAFDLTAEGALPRPIDRAEIEAGITAGEVRLLGNDPYTRLDSLPTNLKPKHVDRRDKAMKIIAPIVELPGDGAFTASERGPAIGKVAAATSTSKPMIYWYLRKYWRGGQHANALLPNFKNCGAPGKDRRPGQTKRGRRRKLAAAGLGINIGTEERKLFALGVKTFYDNPKNPNKMSLRLAFDKTLQRYFNRELVIGPDGKPRPVMPPADQLPTFRQFQYWFHKDRNMVRSLTAREGIHKFNQNHRALGGDAAAGAFGPGSVYQIDSTKADLYLVSQYDRGKVIGRATIYLIVDVFSGLIAGFYAGLENASYLAAALALENAATDKVAFCAAHGISISAEEWPSQHLPETLYADRGELIGKMADQLTQGLNITVTNTPAYRPDLKPFVERAFRTTNDELLHQLPGAVDRDHERGDPDYRLKAKLTLADLQEALIHFILHFNRSRIEARIPREFMVTDKVEPRPNELWAWGIKNRSGHLRVMPPEMLRLQLLPADEASVTEKGLLFKGLYYRSETAEREQWQVRARAKGRWKVPVTYDPRVADKIYLHLSGANVVEACTLLEQHDFFNGVGWAEVEFFNVTRAVLKESSRSADIQATANYGANVESIVADAVEKTKEARSGASNRGKISGICANRTAERERNDAALSSGAAPPIPTVTAAGPGRDQEVRFQNGYIPMPSDLDLFKKQQNEQWSNQPHAN